MDTKFKSGYFVIGTDTDIGKTYISSILYSSIKDINGGYYKPVQSGCFEENGKLIAPDVKFICSQNEIDYDDSMVTYTLKAEVSPHLALELEKTKIDIEKIKEKFKNLKKKYEYLIVEGAGGLYVPLIRDEFYIYDLIKTFDFPVVLVCGSRVGAINHTMLTIEALKNLGIKVHGIVFNKVTNNFERDYFEKDNIDIILKLTGIENYMIIHRDEKNVEIEKVRKFLKIGG